MIKKENPKARGSDVSRSKKQRVARQWAAFVVSLFRLNRGGYLTTEIIQQIQPICRIPTSFGELLCRGGHGRLRWRAETFYTEEPETVKWLDSIKDSDYLWDVGANVGLYSIYAAKQAGCRVLSFEPEAQNFATLIENIMMNGLQALVEPSPLPINREFSLGRLYVHDLTKGGAYNQFDSDPGAGHIPKSSELVPFSQVQIGVSIDELVERFGFEIPTHIKIDVDGIEPDIIAGAEKTLTHPTCRHLLIEVEIENPIHKEMLRAIEKAGFQLMSQRSNWESRDEKEALAKEYPVTNMIFGKD